MSPDPPITPPAKIYTYMVGVLARMSTLCPALLAGIFSSSSSVVEDAFTVTEYSNWEKALYSNAGLNQHNKADVHKMVDLPRNAKYIRQMKSRMG